VLMSALESFFKYGMTTSCGMREVVLEGTPLDWETLRTQAAALAELGGGRIGKALANWFELVDNTLAKLVLTAYGAPDAEFWQRIYCSHTPRGSGAQTHFSGWALHFFLFDSKGQYIKHADCTTLWIAERPEQDVFGGLTEDRIPSLVTVAPVTWSELSGAERALELYSGSWAIGVTPHGDVMPILQWLVCEQTPKHR
jgi:Domain of unknown function (DUF4419)